MVPASKTAIVRALAEVRRVIANLHPVIQIGGAEKARGARSTSRSPLPDRPAPIKQPLPPYSVENQARYSPRGPLANRQPPNTFNDVRSLIVTNSISATTNAIPVRNAHSWLLALAGLRRIASAA